MPDKYVIFEVIGNAQDVLDTIDKCSISIMTWTEENNINNFTTREVKNKFSPEFSNPTLTRALATLIGQGKLIKSQRGHYSRLGLNLNDFSKAEKSNNQKDQNSNDPIDSKTTYEDKESIES